MTSLASESSPDISDLVFAANGSRGHQLSLSEKPTARTFYGGWFAKPDVGDEVESNLRPLGPANPDALGDKLVPLVLAPDPPELSRDVFQVLQYFEGRVTTVAKDRFEARLNDRTTAGVDKVAVFDIEEVAPTDRALLMDGAIFYWSIGYYDAADGERTRRSRLVFRRLPALSSSRRAIRERDAWVEAVMSDIDLARPAGLK